MMPPSLLQALTAWLGASLIAWVPWPMCILPCLFPRLSFPNCKMRDLVFRPRSQVSASRSSTWSQTTCLEVWCTQLVPRAQAPCLGSEELPLPLRWGPPFFFFSVI